MDDVWMWPATDWFWPNPNGQETVAEFADVFKSFGYELCGGPLDEDGCKLEEDFDRIALYEKLGDNGQAITHVARQLADGRWTSKLANLIDISHDLNELPDRGEYAVFYGQATHFFKRRKKGTVPHQLIAAT